jgi:hypothetical protein
MQERLNQYENPFEDDIMKSELLEEIKVNMPEPQFRTYSIFKKQPTLVILSFPYR